MQNRTSFSPASSSFSSDPRTTFAERLNMTAKYALLAFRRRKRKMKQKKEDKELHKVECQHIDGNLLLVAKV